MAGLLKSQMCGARGQKWGIREGFELDMEGTAEIGEMARGEAGVLGCGEEVRKGTYSKGLEVGMSECVCTISAMGTE